MIGLSNDEHASRAYRDDWSGDNARGLAYAAVGSWSDAADAFAQAAEAVESPQDVSSHEALALVLNNLAHACFRANRADEGIRYAQRACSLRAALLGEDALSVARARADLAVMLGSVGRAHEGLQLIGRAITSIERTAGDEDLRLSTALENAARLAMAAGEPSTAEPYLLRLHALLAEHELPTDAADALLARVAAHRTSAVPFVDDAALEDDDEPLRDAVQLTDLLLRTTPTHVKAIDVPADIDVVREPAVHATQPVDDDQAAPVLDLIEPTPAASLPALAVDLSLATIELEPIPLADIQLAPDTRAKADDVFGGAHFDLVESEAEARANAHAAKQAASRGRSDVLGFQVEYGTPSADALDELMAGRDAPPTSVRIHTPAEHQELSFDVMPTSLQAPIIATPQVATESVEPTVTFTTATGEHSTNPNSYGTYTPRGTPVVMPSPAYGQTAIIAGDASQSKDETPRLTLHTADELARDRRVRRPNIRAGRASAPKSSRGLFIAGGLTAAVAAAAAWFALGAH